jgi:hypothetical protein
VLASRRPLITQSSARKLHPHRHNLHRRNPRDLLLGKPQALPLPGKSYPGALTLLRRSSFILSLRRTRQLLCNKA